MDLSPQLRENSEVTWEEQKDSIFVNSADRTAYFETTELERLVDVIDEPDQLWLVTVQTRRRLNHDIPHGPRFFVRRDRWYKSADARQRIAYSPKMPDYACAVLDADRDPAVLLQRDAVTEIYKVQWDKPYEYHGPVEDILE